MREADFGGATLTNVDKDTFIRFVQWSYTGCYSPAPHHDIPNPQGMGENGNIDGYTRSLHEINGETDSAIGGKAPGRIPDDEDVNLTMYRPRVGAEAPKRLPATALQDVHQQQKFKRKF